MNLATNLTDTCRLCLCKSKMCISLFENEGEKIVFALTSINIKDGINLPTSACIKCWLSLKLAYRIQQNIIEKNKKLLNLFKNDEKQREDNVLNKNIGLELSYENDNILEIESNRIQVDSEEKNPNNNLNEPIAFYGNRCLICNAQNRDTKMESHIKSHFTQSQKCDECNLELENAEIHQQHLINEHNLKSEIYKCSKCLRTFKYKCFYEMHTRKGHSQLNNNENYNNYRLLNQKEISSKRPAYESLKSLQCLQCNKYYKSRNNLSAHIRMHQRKRCPHCNSAVTLPNFSNHVKDHLDSQKICSICGRILKNGSSLRRHLSLVHSTKTYSCPYCNKTYTNNYKKNLHIKKEHTGEKDYICELCGKAFFTEFARTKHYQNVHLKQRNFVCKFCSKGFSTKTTLRTHERQHTNETPYKCDICGEGFRQNVSLKSHKKSKHNIMEELTESCSICEKKFSSKVAVGRTMDSRH